jgi:hypothetical protein
MDEEEQLQQGIIQHTDLSLQPGVNPELFRQKLAEYINLLINNDFNKLILILYRLDISEKKLKQLLASSPGSNAGSLIAALIIERQLEKIQSRKHFKQPRDSIPEEDRW